MAHVEPDYPEPADDRLAEKPVRAYLGTDETVRAVLSNTRVGVERVTDAGSRRIEPGADHGALAVLTDRRALFVVGRPDGDDVTAVPYVECSRVDARTETLTRTLVVETVAGATWEFTVRESDALDDAMDALAAAIPERLISRARANREAAADAAEAGDCRGRIEALEATVDAYRRATTVVENPDLAARATRDEAEAAIETLVDALLERARDRRSVGNWAAEAGEVEDALERFEDAAARFERARRLAERYPPGDADAIADEHEHLLEKCDAVEVTASVSSVLE